MIKKNYAFSVIMAIYNVEKYLDEAILSVVNQSFSFEKNIQLILVNDGSPDNCDKICKKYLKKYPSNVVYIKKQNGGVSSARNAGLEVASGKYVNFLDSDDYFSANSFEDVYNFFKANQNKTDVVAIKLINFENSSGSWVNKDYFEKDQLIDMQKESNFMQCQVGASFVKRDVAQKYRFDENIKIHEDSHYLYRIFCEKPFCGVLSNAVYWHRIRASGTSATQTIKTKANILCLTNKLFKELVEIYIKKYEGIPSFLQTFILLEFNYYVVQKIKECKFSKSEKKELSKNINYIFNSININNINNHFVLDNESKEILRRIKINSNNIFKKHFAFSLLKVFKKFVNKLKRIIKKIFVVLRKAILFFPRMIFKKIFLRIEALEKDNRYFAELTEINQNLIKKMESELLGVSETYSNKLEKINSSLSNLDEGLSAEFLSVKNEIGLKLSNLNESLNTEFLNIKNEINFYDSFKIKYFLYFHSGSNNKGCEALAKTIAQTLNATREEIMLLSFRKKEDIFYNLNRFIKYIEEPTVTNENSKLAFMGNCSFSEEDGGIKNILSNLDENAVAISIGGDNYCYGEYVNGLLNIYNETLHEKGLKTALIGCSIEPEILKDQKVLRDLNLYDLIVARESITYDALIKSGITKNTHLVPDTAFLLENHDPKLPNNFKPGETIGINISPLIQDFEKQKNIILKNYINLVEYIINNTKYNVALIPHVFWDKSNDLIPLTEIYNSFLYTGRVCLIGNHSSEELKGYISKCKMFIGARTHATIAAYSSMIPTLAIGYSVKANGIAKDLFGDYKDYVVSVNSLKGENDLIESFKWLSKNYDFIKNHLEDVIPKYVERIQILKNHLYELEQKNTIKELPNMKKCVGCGACVSVCPQKCITFAQDAEGFYYPEVNYKKCTNCELCKKSCPINNTFLSKEPIKILAAQSKNELIRVNSSSGGVFSEIATFVLKEKGVVVGASLSISNEIKLCHTIIDNISDLYKIQGSKYFQSDMQDIYFKIEEILKKGKTVLFSGTPCQAQGLRSYLKKDYINLICLDVVCHGVPSPKVFMKYKESLEIKENSKIIKMDFRNKDNGWNNYNIKYYFANKNIIKVNYSNDLFMKGFLKNLYLRPCCYNCQANKYRSSSDITLGDFWGVEKYFERFDDDKGTSLVMINSDKGVDVYNKIKKRLKTYESDLKTISENNPSIYISPKKNQKRELFFENLDFLNIEENITKNLNPDGDDINEKN